MRALVGVTAAAVLAVATTGADAQLVDCRGGQRPSQVAGMMFGRNIGNRSHGSEAAWGRFVAAETTPRFPAGLTMFDAAGQGRDKASNRIIREPSKIVQIVLPGEADDIARLNEIAAAYKARFKQQSVGMIVRAACISF